MIVKKILIIDHANGEAGEFNFKPGANLLVSADNSQGKSSLLKTMYYGLGLDIKIFPANWNPTKMTIKLDLFNERTSEDAYVVRKGDLFYVPGIVGSITQSDYTKWLSDQLGVNLKLTNKNTKITSSISHPSALITPFYVDQDESWSGRLFSSSSDVNMYAETPQRIFEYILKISDDDDLKTKEKISRLKAKKSTISLKRSNLNDVYMDYIDDDSNVSVGQISSIFNPAEANNNNVDLFMKLMDEANKKYIEHKANRIKLQRELDQKKKTAEEYRSIMRMYKSDYSAIKSVCKNCKSELTEEQVRTRMEIDTNIFELSYLITSIDQDIRELEGKVAVSIELEMTTNNEYKKLSSQIDANQDIKSIAEYIEEASKKKSQEEFASIIQKLDTHLGEIDSEIKELAKQLRESVKDAKALVEKIHHSYSDYVNDLSTIMAGSNVSNISFKSFKAPQSSGVNVNQAYLGAYLAYMRLISDYGRYRLPFCIDSFIKNETADNRSDAMFEATEKYLMSLEGQAIFSAIEESVDRFMKNAADYNRVDIGGRLLSVDKFKSGLAEIKDIVVIS